MTSHVSMDFTSMEVSSEFGLEPSSRPAAAAAAGGKGGAELDPPGDPIDPNCIDRKYLVAACRSCSLSSAVWRLKKHGA